MRNKSKSIIIVNVGPCLVPLSTYFVGPIKMKPQYTSLAHNLTKPFKDLF